MSVMTPKQETTSVFLPEPIYDHLNVAGLRSLLHQRGLAVSGNRADLMNRLSESDAASKSVRSSEPHPSGTHDEDQDVGGLVARCHERGQVASGNQADLLSPLSDHDDDLGSVDCDAPESDDPLCEIVPLDKELCPSSVRIIPFDGRGCDPESLIGLRIEGYKHDPDALSLFCGDGSIANILGGGSEHSRIVVDKVLINALEKEGDLLIEAATTALRSTCREKYRVVGIKCEGMKRMGFIRNENKTMRPDGFPPKRLGWTHRFSDVTVEWLTLPEESSDEQEELSGDSGELSE